MKKIVSFVAILSFLCMISACAATTKKESMICEKKQSGMSRSGCSKDFADKKECCSAEASSNKKCCDCSCEKSDCCCSEDSVNTKECSGMSSADKECCDCSCKNKQAEKKCSNKVKTGCKK
ncbi:MAG: hypothetical protein FWF00_01335 [Endomicrobia bacterium]|nr:hypothetical protein [Endomicrobiia bacterium]MCL2506318.1 hypothetical protein [Endomicrobiia bacterium]